MKLSLSFETAILDYTAVPGIMYPGSIFLSSFTVRSSFALFLPSFIHLSVRFT